MKHISHKEYIYVPIEYIEGLVKLQETIRMMQKKLESEVK